MAPCFAIGSVAPGPRAPSLLRGCFSFCRDMLRIIPSAFATLGTEPKEAAPQGLTSDCKQNVALR